MPGLLWQFIIQLAAFEDKSSVGKSEIGIRFPQHMLDSQGQQFSSDIG